MTDDRLFRALLITGAVVVLPILAYYRVRSQLTRERLDRKQEGVFILLTLRPIGLAAMLGLIAFMVDPSTMAWSSVALPRWARWIGAVIAASGGILIVWTLRNLGPNLTDTVVTRKVHTMVTSGPYRVIRHPFYVAMALMLFGNAIAAANWFILLAGVVVIALIVVRARTEEAKLVERFGDAYRAYMDRTGRFIPK